MAHSRIDAAHLRMLGGWPGAFLAQRVFRHKTSKLSYQVVFWAIVLVYQLVALDYLTGWFTKDVMQSVLPQGG